MSAPLRPNEDDDLPLSQHRHSLFPLPVSSANNNNNNNDNEPIGSAFPNISTRVSTAYTVNSFNSPSSFDHIHEQEKRLSLTYPTSPILSQFQYTPPTHLINKPVSTYNPNSGSNTPPLHSMRPLDPVPTSNYFDKSSSPFQPHAILQVKNKLSMNAGRLVGHTDGHRQSVIQTHSNDSSTLRRHSQQVPITRRKSLVKRERDPHLSMITSSNTLPVPMSQRKHENIQLPPPRISTNPLTLPRNKDYKRATSNYRKLWVHFSKIVTFYAIPPLFKAFGIHNENVQQACREKLALCTIILSMMGALAFLTLSLNDILCQPAFTRINASEIGEGFVLINGFAFDVTNYPHNFQSFGKFPFNELNGKNQSRQNRDLTFMFQKSFGSLPECVDAFGPEFINSSDYLFHCTIGGIPPSNARKFGNYPVEYCHPSSPAVQADIQSFVDQMKRVQLFVTWEELQNTNNPYMSFNGDVIDLSVLDRLKQKPNFAQVNGINFSSIFAKYRNKDASLFMSSNSTLASMGKCISKFARVGSLDSSTMGCIASQVILWVSMLVILSLVLSRFFMALLFRWIISPKLGRKLSMQEKRDFLMQRRVHDLENEAEFAKTSTVFPNHTGNSMNNRASYSSAYHGGSADSSTRGMSTYGGQVFFPTSSTVPLHLVSENMTGMTDRSTTYSSQRGSSSPFQPISLPDTGFTERSTAYSSRRGSSSPFPSTSLPEPNLQVEEVMHTILLVTCYSEDEAGIRNTLNSLAATTYQDSHKLLFVIADGIIIGSGNSFSTPDMLVSMLEKDPAFPEQPKPYSYVAIADGVKRHNMAVVHAGYYHYESHKVPMVIVVKCGGPEEQGLPKAGNRGKRDSQVVLMSFLQKIIFDERMTPLEYDLFQKIHKITKVTPDAFEVVLCVDADTKVAPDSLERMVACFARDSKVMGLCGETQIQNKWGSWVTMIQVFEYYISHHLSKAFESVFGNVTCLPGCFSAWRIKAPKGEHSRHWVPILANPDILDQYQENVVETLHEKNLFLLGEDRYLTTLMLRTFPRRKMLFVPQATCETTVPDQLSVLLSQRRRWINSTIHNLLELILVKDLCGTFCISMQFVIFMELIGTVVLPAAISFTIYLVIISFFTTPVPIIPLLLLAAILGLPGLLIVMTTRKIQFLFWMLVYIISLPLWNFLLPAYAFWHFDDFSWGATRVIEGDKDGHADADGEFDSSKIIMKRWSEWEKIKQRAIEQAIEAAAQQHQQAYRRSQLPTQMQAYYGVENRLVRENGLQYTM